MDTTNEKSAATRLRLCPSPGRHVAVSAFNAPL